MESMCYWSSCWANEGCLIAIVVTIGDEIVVAVAEVVEVVEVAVVAVVVVVVVIDVAVVELAAAETVPQIFAVLAVQQMSRGTVRVSLGVQIQGRCPHHDDAQ
jgi:hypothetical protein